MKRDDPAFDYVPEDAERQMMRVMHRRAERWLLGLALAVILFIVLLGAFAVWFNYR